MKAKWSDDNNDIEYEGHQISIHGPEGDPMRYVYIDDMYYGMVPTVGAEEAAREMIHQPEIER